MCGGEGDVWVGGGGVGVVCVGGGMGVGVHGWMGVNACVGARMWVCVGKWVCWCWGCGGVWEEKVSVCTHALILACICKHA